MVIYVKEMYEKRLGFDTLLLLCLQIRLLKIKNFLDFFFFSNLYQFEHKQSVTEKKLEWHHNHFFFIFFFFKR